MEYIEAIEQATATQKALHLAHSERQRRFYRKDAPKPLPASLAIVPPEIPKVTSIPNPPPKLRRTWGHKSRIVQDVVARAFNVTSASVRGPERTAPIVMPRQIGMYICRELLHMSFPEIGRRFGGRDHTTALHSYQKIARLMAGEEMQSKVSGLVDSVRERIAQQENPFRSIGEIANDLVADLEPK